MRKYFSRLLFINHIPEKTVWKDGYASCSVPTYQQAPSARRIIPACTYLLVELACDAGTGKQCVRFIIVKLQIVGQQEILAFKPDSLGPCGQAMNRLGNGNDALIGPWVKTTDWLYGLKYSEPWQWVEVHPPVEFYCEDAMPVIERMEIRV